MARKQDSGNRTKQTSGGRPRTRTPSGGSSSSGGARLLGPAELEAAIVELTAAAKAQGIDAAVLGGFAMQHYGSPRLTADVDLVAQDRLAGYKPVGTLSFGGARIETSAGVPVDWIVRDDEYTGLYEEALRKAKVFGRRYRLVAPEYLAAMKLASGRPKDHEDLLFLLQQPGVVDRAAARKLVYKYVGGRFAADSFDRVCDEADWRLSRER